MLFHTQHHTARKLSIGLVERTRLLTLFARGRVTTGRKAILVLTLVLLIATDQVAMAESGRFKLTTRVEYTTGEFGGTESIDEWYVPVTGKYITGPYVFRLTVPYIRLTAPAGTVAEGADGSVIATGGGARTTEDGLGDIVAGLTYRDVFSTDTSADFAVDLTGKVKFGTADEDKGLGTGENDYTVQVDLIKFYNRFSLYGTLGYKFRGEPSGVDLDNVWLGVVGGMYEIGPKLKGGLDVYYREASFPGGSEQQELTGFLGYRLSDTYRLQGYLINGFSDASPDWGGGLMLTTVFER